MCSTRIPVVLAALTALALLLGAVSGCSQPTPDTPAPVASETVDGHSHAAADESCFICDPSKRDPDRLWCSEHARYEDRCWVCQPQLEDKDRMFCQEHGLYEDECFLCRPALADTAATTIGGELFCNEHQVAEHECGICQPQLASLLAPGEELKVRFESARSAEKAGLSTQLPETSRTSARVAALCEVRYNENSVARVTPFAPGIVRRVRSDVGATVKRGDVLVELHSAELAEARAAFVSAMVDAKLKARSFERQESLATKAISSEKTLQEAEAAHQTAILSLAAARQRLMNYGLSDGEVSRIAETGDASATLLVRAPYAGTLVERDAVMGEAVEPGQALFTLADLSTMWLSLAVATNDAHLLKPGLPVRALLGGAREIDAELIWVSTSVDERSRMVNARAVVNNEARSLRAGMFGEASILLTTSEPILSVPVDAVQYLKGRPHVFVRHEADLYGLRRVDGARTGNGQFAVSAGLQPGEALVVDGAFTALSEFLKSRLGAGCVDE